MKIPSSGDKISILDTSANSSEAVKVSTRAKGQDNSEKASNAHVPFLPDQASDRATSIKIGLAKYISEELDPTKVASERQAKIADITARIQAGTYLSSVSSDEVSKQLLEDSKLEKMVADYAANDE